MKRLLCLALVLLFVVPAFAEGLPDISKLSKEQLLELNGQICKQIELLDEFEPFEVPVGYWIVGENIPAGEYCISVKNLDRYSYVNIPREKNNGKEYNHSMGNEDELPYVVLVEGAEVNIFTSSVMFSPAKPVKFGF